MIKEVVHPFWGSNLKNQTRAEKVLKEFGGIIREKINKPFLFFFTREVEVMSYTESLHEEAKDTDHVRREYEHTCFLKRIIINSDNSRLTLFLDGHTTVQVASTNTEFIVDPSKFKYIHLDNPIVFIEFNSRGQCYGPLYSEGTHYVKCYFKSQEQMEKYLNSISCVIQKVE